MTKRNPIKGMPPSKDMYLLAKARSNKILAKINDTSKALPKVNDTSPTLEKIEVATKIKVIMYDWYGGIDNLPDWFKPREEAEITWKQLQELYESGISFLLKKPNENGVSILVVSLNSF